MSHSPEPWQLLPFNNPDDHFYRPGTLLIGPVDPGEHYHSYIARLFHPMGGPGANSNSPPVAMAEANAQRIVACVNACAGVPTEHLARLSVKELLERLEFNEQCTMDREI